MKQRYPMGDDMASLTLLLSWNEDAPGKTVHGIVSLENLTLDGRGDEAAQFATLEDLKLLVGAGVRAQLVHCDLVPSGGALAELVTPPDPVADVRYTLQFLLTLPAGAPMQTDAILVVFGRMRATAIDPPTDWPEVTTNASDFSLKTAGGSPISAQWIEVTP